MADIKIEYNECFGIGTFKREIIAWLGEQTWEKITCGGIVPDIETEARCKCANMVVFMARLESVTDRQTVKKILIGVRHGLKPAQSEWAREEFLHAANLDAFIEQQKQQGILDFEMMLKEKKDFYGQPVTDEIVEFIKGNPSMLSGIRSGNKLYLTAFAAQMHNYLNASDSKMKRYYACHCPFAKESILTDAVVTPALCNCSLGHIMNFLEAAFDTKLDGEVLNSALRGDEFCSFAVNIPDSVLNHEADRRDITCVDQKSCLL